MFHMDLGLGRVSAALAALGLDSPPFLSVQVAGTNGKGSTSTFLARILTESGFRTGLYTSPHFVSPRERILVDGRQLPESGWLDAAEAVLRVSADVSGEKRLTYFELITVMAAWLFRESGCRACVFEAGLGGAHDATTALRHDLTVFTPIGLDHVSILGPAIADIARDKAGAMRRGVPAVTGPQEPEAMEVLTRAAISTGAPLYLVRPPDERTPQAAGANLPPASAPSGVLEAAQLPDAMEYARLSGIGSAALPDAVPAMPGPHQRGNFRLAAASANLLAAAHGLDIEPGAFGRAAQTAFIPGRFQIIPESGGSPAFVLDGAHNQPGLECLKMALDDLSIRPVAMVFASLADKDLDAMLPLARSLTDGPVFVPPVEAPGRAVPPQELARMLGGDARPAPSVAEAMDKAGQAGGTVLVCGSLYLLGEVYALRPDWLEAEPASGRPGG